MQRAGFLRRRRVDGEERRALSAAYDVRGPGIHARSALLSGGNIQKLILARVLETQPKVILANQPTRGLDFRAAAEVSRRLIAARDRGAGIILISEDLDEVLSLATACWSCMRASLPKPSEPGPRVHRPADGRGMPHDRDRSQRAALAAHDDRRARCWPPSARWRWRPSRWPGRGADWRGLYADVHRRFGSLFSFTEMLTRATPLIFTGLAAAVAFRAKLWNIGGEGQLYLGAMAAVWVGTGMIDGCRRS